MNDSAIISIAAAISLLSLFVYLTIRYVAKVLDTARGDAAEAWKATLSEREARARAEACTMQLTGELARLLKSQMPLKAPLVDDEASPTAPISPDTLRAIARANGMDLALGTDYDADDPTNPPARAQENHGP